MHKGKITTLQLHKDDEEGVPRLHVQAVVGLVLEPLPVGLQVWGQAEEVGEEVAQEGVPGLHVHHAVVGLVLEPLPVGLQAEAEEEVAEEGVPGLLVPPMRDHCWSRTQARHPEMYTMHAKDYKIKCASEPFQCRLNTIRKETLPLVCALFGIECNRSS